MFVAAQEQERNREEMEQIFYSNMVSDDEDDEEITKSRHTTKGHIALFKPFSCNGNLITTTAREENVHDLTSPGTQLPTQPPVNAILTEIKEEKILPSQRKQS